MAISIFVTALHNLVQTFTIEVFQPVLLEQLHQLLSLHRPASIFVELVEHFL
jgi:hypothetical protein